MKKNLLVILMAITLSTVAHASGYMHINCKSEHSAIDLYHFGSVHTVDGVQLVVDGAITTPKSPPFVDGNDLHVEDGNYSFFLINLFEQNGEGYAVPDFELQVKVFGEQYVTYEKGKCVLH